MLLVRAAAESAQLWLQGLDLTLILIEAKAPPCVILHWHAIKSGLLLAQGSYTCACASAESHSEVLRPLPGSRLNEDKSADTSSTAAFASFNPGLTFRLWCHSLSQQRLSSSPLPARPLPSWRGRCQFYKPRSSTYQCNEALK